MKELIKHICKGDHSAYELFYKAEFNNVLFFISRYIKDNQSAKDIVQESFIALWNNREKIDNSKNIRTFIFTIAKNKAINFLKSSHHKMYGNKNILDVEIKVLSDVSTSDAIEALSLEQLITKIYDDLPKKSKDSFMLSRMYNLNTKEISMIRGISQRTVEHHLQKSLEHFKKKLKDYFLFF